MDRLEKEAGYIGNEFSRLRRRYFKMSQIFIVFVILFIIWIIFIALGVALLEMAPNWALLTLDQWVLVWSSLIAVFIVLEIVFYLRYSSTLGKGLKEEKPPESIHGKRLYVYTHPKSAEGGIFSKTYIQIDENSVLRLRSLMIPSEEVWSKK